jgi:hypothetical protein
LTMIFNYLVFRNLSTKMDLRWHYLSRLILIEKSRIRASQSFMILKVLVFFLPFTWNESLTLMANILLFLSFLCRLHLSNVLLSFINKLRHHCLLHPYLLLHLQYWHFFFSQLVSVLNLRLLNLSFKLINFVDKLVHSSLKLVAHWVHIICHKLIKLMQL